MRGLPTAILCARADLGLRRSIYSISLSLSTLSIQPPVLAPSLIEHSKRKRISHFIDAFDHLLNTAAAAAGLDPDIARDTLARVLEESARQSAEDAKLEGSETELGTDDEGSCSVASTEGRCGVSPATRDAQGSFAEIIGVIDGGQHKLAEIRSQAEQAHAKTTGAACSSSAAIRVAPPPVTPQARFLRLDQHSKEFKLTPIARRRLRPIVLLRLASERPRHQL